jgi:hypothetical protein
MGRIDAVISDDLEAKLRMEILKRFKGKKGDLKRAVEEAIELWINKPTIENLRRQATNVMLPSKEREEATKILGEMGDSATDTFLEIGNPRKKYGKRNSQTTA